MLSLAKKAVKDGIAIDLEPVSDGCKKEKNASHNQANRNHKPSGMQKLAKKAVADGIAVNHFGIFKANPVNIGNHKRKRSQENETVESNKPKRAKMGLVT